MVDTATRGNLKPSWLTVMEDTEVDTESMLVMMDTVARERLRLMADIVRKVKP